MFRQQWRVLQMLVAALFSLAMVGCASFGGPRVIRLDQADLIRLIERQFPLERRAFELIDLRVDRPDLVFLPDANRLAITLDVEAGERISGRRYRGQLAFDSALRIDQIGHAVRLNQVRVTRLVFDDLSASLSPVVDRLGGLVAEQVLEGLPIYRFRDQDLRRAEGMNLRPGDVNITARGVEISLLPLKQAR